MEVELGSGGGVQRLDYCTPPEECPYRDHCGVCNGDGTSCTASGCECLEESYTIQLAGCLERSFIGCTFHSAGGSEEGPCNSVFEPDAAAFAAAHPGQSYCQVAEECEGAAFDVEHAAGSAPFDYCRPPPDCPFRDACGVCDGDGSTCTTMGCECVEVWSLALAGCEDQSFNGCQYHTAEEEPCNPLAYSSAADFAAARPGESWCVVEDANCPTPFSAGESKIDYCTP
jgi:hypothetical protein